MRKVLLLVGLMLLSLGYIFAQDKPLVRYDEEAFEKVAKKVDQKLYNDMLPWGEKVFEKYLEHKGIKVEFTESDYNAIKTERDGLKAERDALQTERDNLKTERDGLKAERDALQTERDNLKTERDGLKAERDALQMAQTKLENVITQAENKINSIYNANKDRSLTEMKASDLKEAADAYVGIKSLIEYRPLQNGTREKLNLINAWNQLKIALDESVRYMEGKYDSNKRTTCIASINKAVGGVTLAGKQLSEKESILNALNEQATVNAKFNELLNYLINDFVVIPSKKDAADALALINGKTIKNIDNSTKQIVVTPNQYHKKHAEALKELREMMSEAATKGPNKNLQIEADFRNTLERIRNKYQ